MTLFKALSMSEEYSMPIIHRSAGLKIRAGDHEIDYLTLPPVGWELEVGATPVSFTCVFLGCDAHDLTLIGGKKGAIYSFEGEGIQTFMPEGTKVKVTIEAI